VLEVLEVFTNLPTLAIYVLLSCLNTTESLGACSFCVSSSQQHFLKPFQLDPQKVNESSMF
jgi:hypothetical protein